MSEPIEYDDLLITCESNRKTLQRLMPGIDLADVKKPKTQLEKAALCYVAAHKLVKYLEERKTMLSDFLKQHIEPEADYYVEGVILHRSKLTAKVDKKAWAELQKIDRQVAKDVRDLKAAKKRVKEHKDGVSEWSGSSLSWKVANA